MNQNGQSSLIHFLNCMIYCFAISNLIEPCMLVEKMGQSYRPWPWAVA